MSAQHTSARDAITFFEGLNELSPLIRFLLGAGPLTASLQVRGESPAWLLLDATRDPVRITRHQGQAPSTVKAAATAQVWADILSGRVAPGAAFGRRELLLRGSASELARLIPLLELAPPLFRDHVSNPAGSVMEAQAMSSTRKTILSSIAAPRAQLARVAATGLRRAAYWTGYSLGTLQRRGIARERLLDLLASAARGWERAVPAPAAGPNGAEA